MGFGIDFGTTNSVAAFCDARTEQITAFMGDDGRPHPSVVWLRASGPAVVGAEAKAHIEEFADQPGHQFVSSIKRQLGRGRSFHLFGQSREPFEVAAEIFGHLRSHARARFDKEISEAVVTVPVYYGGPARREIRRAADQAGIYVKAFIHEPFAALVGYLFAKGGRPELERLEARNVVVFDWGGGTLDVTVVELRRGQLVERGVSGLEDEAGDLFDRLLENEIRGRVGARNGWSPEEMEIPAGAKDRLRVECERRKIELSGEFTTKFQLAKAIRAAGGTHAIREDVSRQEFESLIRPYVQKAMHEVDTALERAELAPSQIDRVLLVGGTSRIPLIRSELQTRFGARIVDAPNADTLIAEGAAAIDALGLEPVLAKPVTVELSDGSYYTVFDEGHPARAEACRRSVNFFCTDNRDGEARLVLAGDSTRTKAGRFTLNIPVAPGTVGYTHERVAVEFALDQDMILNVAGKGATRKVGSQLQIHDLCFGLSL